MRQMMTVLFFLFAACGGSASVDTPPAVPSVEPPFVEVAADAPPPTDDATTVTGDGASCLTGSDCASGTCEGVGCGDDTPGTCKSQLRLCTMDMRPMCDCEGNNFEASSTCPGRRTQTVSSCPPVLPR